MALAADGREIYFKVSIRSLDVRYQKHEICAIPLLNTVGGFLSMYIDGYANDPLEIKLVVCGDNFEIKDMRTPFSVIHDFGSVLCVYECVFLLILVYECVFLLILGMHKRNYIGISSRNKLN